MDRTPVRYLLLILRPYRPHGPVRAEQSYPWCAQGDNTLHCYYVTREQCEQAVDYHGFCVANYNVPTPNDEAPQQRIRRRRGI